MEAVRPPLLAGAHPTGECPTGECRTGECPTGAFVRGAWPLAEALSASMVELIGDATVGRPLLPLLSRRGVREMGSSERAASLRS